MSKHGALQLQRLVLHYCKHSGSSRGAREFVETSLAALQAANPGLQLSVELRPGKHPYFNAEYANGHIRAVDVKNLDVEEIAFHASFLRTEKGHRTGTKIKRHLTSDATSSIQGAWTAQQNT